jgi:hypothetical protein
MSGAAAPITRPRRRWIWVMVAILTVLVVLPATTLRIVLKADIQHQISDPLNAYSQPILKVVVHAPGGVVSISRGDGSSVTVSSNLTWLVAKPAVRPVLHGATLEISASCPRPDPFEDCQVSLNIQVPAEVSVQVNVGSGSIEATDLAGPLDLSATTGAIGLTDVSGPVWASVTSGSVAGSRLSSPRLHASAGSGSVGLDFVSPPQLLDLKVGGGTGSVTVPRGTRYQVSAQHGPGFLQIYHGISDAAAPGVIIARVSTGTLAIAYPPWGRQLIFARSLTPRLAHAAEHASRRRQSTSRSSRV